MVRSCKIFSQTEICESVFCCDKILDINSIVSIAFNLKLQGKFKRKGKHSMSVWIHDTKNGISKGNPSLVNFLL